MSTFYSEFAGLSIVVPARNEAARIAEVLRELKEVFPGAELVVVDNASTDDTAAVACSVGAKVVKEPEPGKGRAMRTGAAAASGEYLMFHDADGEYLAQDACQAVRAVQQGGAGMAIGARLVELGDVPLSSYLANRLIRSLLRRRTKVDVVDILTGTRVFLRSLFFALRTQEPHFGIETEITLKVARRGQPIVAVPMRYRPRSKAEGKKIRPYHLFRLVQVALS